MISGGIQFNAAILMRRPSIAMNSNQLAQRGVARIEFQAGLEFSHRTQPVTCIQQSNAALKVQCRITRGHAYGVREVFRCAQMVARRFAPDTTLLILLPSIELAQDQATKKRHKLETSHGPIEAD